MSAGQPEGASLKALGLYAPDGLDCAEGGLHHVLEPELQVAVGDVADAGSTKVRCQKCGQAVELRSLYDLE